MESPLRIVIADDHALFRQGLKSQLLLMPGVTVVGEVGRAADLAETLERTPCDILLLDLQMERSCLVDIEPLSEKTVVVVVTAAGVRRPGARVRAGLRRSPGRRSRAER